MKHHPRQRVPPWSAKLLQILPETRAIKLTYPRNSNTIRAPSHFAHIFFLLIFICPFVLLLLRSFCCVLFLSCILLSPPLRLQFNSNFGHGRFFMLYNPNDNCSPIWGQSFTGPKNIMIHHRSHRAYSGRISTLNSISYSSVAEWNQNLQNQRGRLI